MIHFLPASPKPHISQTDALWNEANALYEKFGGRVESVYPFKRPFKHTPIGFYGRGLLKDVSENDITHVFSPSLRPYPFLKSSASIRMISVASSVAGFSPNYLRKHAFLDKIVVSNERDFRVLTNAGLQNMQLISTGIPVVGEKTRKTYEGGPFRIILASAPWTRYQFKQKGLHLMLELLKKMPEVELCLVWRGLHYAAMQNLVSQHALGHRVQVINEKVDVPKMIKDSHATILIVDDERIIKSHPHSLIESLFVGRPVVISKNIPMADTVKKYGAGVILAEFTIEELKTQVLELIHAYDNYASKAYGFNNYIYDWNRMLSDYGELYAAFGSV